MGWSTRRLASSSPTKQLRLRVEAQRPAELDRDLPQVDERAGAVAVPLVEGEPPPRAHGLGEVRDPRLGVRQRRDLLLEARDVGPEAPEDLPLRALEERRVLVAVLPVEHDRAAVGVLHLDPPPGAAGVGVLLRTVGPHLDRARVVLVEDVLDGVEVVHPHVPEPAAVVVPVAAERAVDAVGVVGLEGRGAEPEVVVELGRDGLGRQARPARPVGLPVEPGGRADRRLDRPAEQPALDGLLDRLDVRPEAVEAVLEAEPGVDPEDAAVPLDGPDDRPALGDGAGHGLLAPDVLAGLERPPPR